MLPMTEEDWAVASKAGLADLGLSRRTVASGGLAALTSYLLLSGVAQAAPRRPFAARRWIERQGELARTLKRGELKPAAWMREVESLASEIDIAQLMAELDKAQVTQLAQPTTNDPRKSTIRFLDASGNPRKLGFGSALFDFAPENVITPHGHRNMVSSHLVVEGNFRVRNFDRLRDEDGAMIIRPTRDYKAGVGKLSAMSSDRDNIHWFVPQGGGAKTFDVIISGIDEALPPYEIEAIDPLGGKLRSDGTIKAAKMSFEAASRKYTSAI